MAKISNLIAYPTVAPQLGDYVIGTDTSSSNETVNFTLQSIADIIPVDTLAEVLAAGNTATNNIILTGNLSITGTYADSSGDVGVSGQVLSSTGAGTNWINNVDGSGTLNTLAKWTPDGDTLGNSSITDDGTSVIVANNIYLQGSEIVLGNQVSDVVTVKGAARFVQKAGFASTILDGGDNAGGSGQVLSSTVTGVQWIDQLPSGLNFQGAWNAATNTPALASGVGVQGYYYIVETPGTTNLDGNNSWQTGDWAIYNGTAWQEIDNQNIFSGSGTSNTMTKWTGAQSLGNSTLTDDGVTLTSTTNISFTGTTNDLGTGTGTNQFYGLNYFYGNARFDGEIRDNVGAAGTAGQVLSSTGTTVEWKSVVDGSGIAGKLPKWLDSDTLTDSSISDNAGAVAITAASYSSNFSGLVQIQSGTSNIDLTAGAGGGFSVATDLRLDAGVQLEFNASNPTIPIINHAPAEFKKTILDSTGGAGTSGQVLSSTATGVQWISSSSSLPLADGTRVATGLMTSAQLLNMFTVPIEIIPAPGAGKLIVVDSVVSKYNYVTNGYSNVNFPRMRYSAGNNVTASSQILFGSSDVYDLKTVTSTTMSVNQSIVFTQLSQNPTGGDSTVFYNVKYRILNTSDLTVDLT
jgi:hypothetical protein